MAAASHSYAYAALYRYLESAKPSQALVSEYGDGPLCVLCCLRGDVQIPDRPLLHPGQLIGI